MDSNNHPHKRKAEDPTNIVIDNIHKYLKVEDEESQNSFVRPVDNEELSNQEADIEELRRIWAGLIGVGFQIGKLSSLLKERAKNPVDLKEKAQDLCKEYIETVVSLISRKRDVHEWRVKVQALATCVYTIVLDDTQALSALHESREVLVQLLGPMADYVYFGRLMQLRPNFTQDLRGLVIQMWITLDFEGLYVEYNYDILAKELEGWCEKHDVQIAIENTNTSYDLLQEMIRK